MDSQYTLLPRALKLLRTRVAPGAAPSPEVYACLRHLDTGDLFTEPLRLAS